jgi:hypothetical protein
LRSLRKPVRRSLSKIVGTIAATLAIAAFMAMSQASAGAVDPGSRYYVKIDNTGDD